jgi:hypothetical protein
MTKHFIYFEDCDGGMSIFTFNSDYVEESLKALYGWLHDDCKDDDIALLDWIETSEVGDYYSHRLGVCIRLKDKEDETLEETDND